MLRVGLSIIVLAGWAAALSAPHSAADDQTQTLTIKGSMAYDADATLPPESQAVIELRHLPTLPNAPAVATERIALDGKKPPVNFEFGVPRFRLVGGAAYVVRVAIVSDKRAIWTADDVKIDVKPDTADVKEITLKAVK